jgi:hypothetical protein
VNRHELKCEPGHFRDVQLGLKKYEVRYNDRGFKVGDEIELVENSCVFGELGGRLKAKITHILHGGYGLQPGFVVLGIDDIQFPWPIPKFSGTFEGFTLKVGHKFSFGWLDHECTLPPGEVFVLEEATGKQAPVKCIVLPHGGHVRYEVIEVCDGS